MREEGEVVGIEKETALVRFNRKEACGKCGMCMFKRDTMHVDMKVQNTLHAETGDRVEVTLADSVVIVSALIVYVLPLLFAAAGLAIGLLAKNELLQLLLCLSFLVIGYIIVIICDRKLRLTRKVVPVMTKIVTEEQRDVT